MIDVSVTDDGTLITITPLTPAAKKIFRHAVVEPHQIRPNGSILLESWAAGDFLEDIKSEGLRVEGADRLLD